MKRRRQVGLWAAEGLMDKQGDELCTSRAGASAPPHPQAVAAERGVALPWVSQQVNVRPAQTWPRSTAFTSEWWTGGETRFKGESTGRVTPVLLLLLAPLVRNLGRLPVIQSPLSRIGMTAHRYFSGTLWEEDASCNLKDWSPCHNKVCSYTNLFIHILAAAKKSLSSSGFAAHGHTGKHLLWELRALLLLLAAMMVSGKLARQSSTLGRVKGACSTARTSRLWQSLPPGVTVPKSLAKTRT